MEIEEAALGVILGDKRCISPYLEILKIFDVESIPLTIKQLAEKTDSSYPATKRRLHILTKHGLLVRCKAGVYSTPGIFDAVSIGGAIPPNIIIVNGAIRRVNKAIRLSVYNIAIKRRCANQHVMVEEIRPNHFLLRKACKYTGRKMYPTVSSGIDLVLSRDSLCQDWEDLNRETSPVRILIDPQEWGLTVTEVYGTESIRDGELAEVLMGYGKVREGRRKDEIKMDLVFVRDGKTAYIEITEAASCTRNQRSNIKSMEIQARFYYGVKAHLMYGFPYFIVISDEWGKNSWLRREEQFLREQGVNLVLTDFKDGWAEQAARQIVALTE